MTFTPEQEAEIRMYRGHYPYRIIYAARNPATGEVVISAVTSMRVPNKLARDGWEVVTIK